ncbi:MAG TPA: hypothetical protein PKD86_18940, partial [Gemmatales bacterium]|nr:hypothetical protein [Gemmatales bacterium]
WAERGDRSRQIDYQVWCGPAMGAFNEWTRDTFLAEPAERKVAVVAMNLLFGAALSQRLHWLRSQRVRLPHEPRWNAPLPLAVLREWAAL